jgi:hypothetical protein
MVGNCFTFLLTLTLLSVCQCDCVYYVNSSKLPNPVIDPKPFIVADDNVCA